jgi:branched-chain amino acid transport system substrate-binding protein
MIPNTPPGPWGGNPTTERSAHIRRISAKEPPQGKVGVLYQNDDYGKDYLKGLKDGLNGKMRIVAAIPYVVTDPTVDSQILDLKTWSARCSNPPAWITAGGILTTE